MKVGMNPGSSALCDVAAWMGGELGGDWIHGYVWLRPHLKPSQSCLSAILPYKIKSFLKNENRNE